MGIGTILTGALKHVSWGQVAQIALNYGPDLLRRLRGQGEPEHLSEPDSMDDPVAEMAVRIAGLEDVVIRQGELIERLEISNRQLGENGRILQARVNVLTGVTAVLAVLILGMFILLLRH